MKKQGIIYVLLLMGLFFCNSAKAVSYLMLDIDPFNKEVYFESVMPTSVRSMLETGDYIFGWVGGDTSGTMQSFTLANNSITVDNGTPVLSATFEVYDGIDDGLKITFNTGTTDPGSGSFFAVTGQNVRNSYSSLDSAHQAILQNYIDNLDAINGGSKVFIQTVPEPATVTLLTAGVATVLLRRRKK